jgi:hypothetical protein
MSVGSVLSIYCTGALWPRLWKHDEVLRKMAINHFSRIRFVLHLFFIESAAFLALSVTILSIFCGASFQAEFAVYGLLNPLIGIIYSSMVISIRTREEVQFAPISGKLCPRLPVTVPSPMNIDTRTRSQTPRNVISSSRSSVGTLVQPDLRGCSAGGADIAGGKDAATRWPPRSSSFYPASRGSDALSSASDDLLSWTVYQEEQLALNGKRVGGSV